MMKTALQFMIERCENEIAANLRAPYYAHLQSAKAVMAGPNGDMVLTNKPDYSA